MKLLIREVSEALTILHVVTFVGSQFLDFFRSPKKIRRYVAIDRRASKTKTNRPSRSLIWSRRIVVHN